MQILETSIFTRRVLELLSDDDYRELQSMLVIRPDAGPVIPGSGGLRKLRWAASGRGKRGGARVIYYWFTSQEQLLMLYIYPKNEQDDLTPDQLKALKKIVEREYP
jgi:mRNA-degrading endonuclease RelE of RelBE toxin-antitoxin system